MRAEIRAIAGRAASLTERLHGGVKPVFTAASVDRAQARLQHWRERVTDGDEEKFRRRLAWDGLDPASALPLLGDVAYAEDAVLPAWTELLAAALARSASLPAHGEAPPAGVTPDAAIPFEEFFLPFVLVARERLKTAAGEADALLGVTARYKLERALVGRLSRIGATTLFGEFSHFRHLHGGGFAVLFARRADGPARGLYLAFIAGLRGEGLLKLFSEYAVLARLLAQATLFWIEAYSEMLIRLACDLPDLAKFFGRPAEWGEVIDLTADLSDPHNEGRTVCSLTFADGFKIVYKPRDLSLEADFRVLLEWLNARGAPVPLKTFRVLPRTTHGWAEFVTYRPCEDADAGRRYFRRGGALACVTYLLNTTDLHFENVIAQGEDPVVVDLETLLHPFCTTEETGAACNALTDSLAMLWDSALRTLLLPQWTFLGDERNVIDLSGLGSHRHQRATFESSRFWDINSDRMGHRRERIEIKSSTSFIGLDEDVLPMEVREQEVIGGFTDTYRFVAGLAESLCAAGGPLQQLAREKVRLLVRPTRTYYRTLSQSFRPNFLRDGIDFSLRVDMITRVIIPQQPLPPPGAPPPRLWFCVAAEREALERGDVPYFLSEADGDRVFVGPDRAAKVSTGTPSFQEVLARLRQMSEANLERQRAFIHGSYFAFRAPRGRGHTGAADGRHRPYEPAVLLAAAEALARPLQKQAIRGSDGTATWIAPQMLLDAGRYQILRVHLMLYDGAGGIVLFLAALHRVTGKPEYRELALAAVEPLRQVLRRPEHVASAEYRFGLGGCVGMGSLMYSVAAAGRLLGISETATDAALGRGAVNAETLQRDGKFDVGNGAAGCILGLLSIDPTGRSPELLDKARQCAEHLLAHRITAPGGRRTWARKGAPPGVGFPHGAAGIALALLRLHQLAPDSRLLEAAKEAIAFEREAAPPESSGPGHGPDNAWCHGPAGIGLARLGGLDVLDDAAIRADIAHAVDACAGPGTSYLDIVCCGQMGRIELLLSAAEKLNRPELAAVARGQIMRILARAGDRDAYELHPLLPPEMLNPGFFTGTSGIGYMLLRAMHPEIIPPVLLWR